MFAAPFFEIKKQSSINNLICLCSHSRILIRRHPMSRVSMKHEYKYLLEEVVCRKTSANLLELFRQIRTNLPELFRQIRTKLPELFRQIRINLPELFRQIRTNLPEQFQQIRMNLQELFQHIRMNLPGLLRKIRSNFILFDGNFKALI